MEDLEGGRPVIKVATSRSAHVSDYEDGIIHIDCRPFWRFFGIHDCPKCLRYMWFVKDVCGVICAIFTWLLVFYAVYVVLFVMLLPGPNTVYSAVNAIIFQWFSFLAVASHVRTMFSDPGAVPMGNATKANIVKLGLKEGQTVYKCPKCVSIKPERAHHCSICRRCIKKMDHHCPWVNNCVGENNQKYFILFTMYICIISCHALYLTINQFVICVGQDWKGCAAYSPAATTVFLIFLLFEAVLFGIFTAIMCGTQLSAVCSDETGIEQLKKEEATWVKKSKWLSLKSVFGHPFSIKWFSPFHSPVYGKQEYYLYNV